MAATDLDAGRMAGGRKITCIAATTGHTDQIQQFRGKLWGVVLGTVAANGSVSIYDSSTNSNLIASILATSGNAPAPLSVDFFGAEFEKLTVVTTGALTVSIVHS